MAEASTTTMNTASVSSTHWTPRQLIFFAGIALWLGSTLVQTRLGGIVALWMSLLLVVGLAVVTSVTRTLTLMDLIQPFCLGGAMLALGVLAGAIFDATVGTGTSRSRALGIPLVEEVLKIAPVLWFLWGRRHAQALTVGATDILLLAAACGIGFGWVEDAFIRHNKGWTGSLAWLPTSETYGDRHGTYLIAGHGAWTALAGLTLGFALILRRPRLPMIGLAASGWLWSVIDHGRNNYGNAYRDALTSTLNFVTGSGWLTAYLLLLGICAAIALDFYFAYIALPKLPETKLPLLSTSWSQMKTALSFLRARNQFAYAVARYQRETDMAKARAATVAASIDTALANWWFGQSGPVPDSQPASQVNPEQLHP